MELRDLEFLWPELYIDSPNKKQLYLSDMVSKLRGEKKICGMTALHFDPVNEENGPIFLTIDCPAGGSTYCLRWDEEKGYWECLGKLYQTFEWGLRLLNRYWNICAIRLKSGEAVLLKDAISLCLGEKYEGLLFKGKGVWEDEMLILKLEREERLENYFEEQKCYRLNRDSDEWEFFGMLIKNPRQNLRLR